MGNNEKNEGSENVEGMSMAWLSAACSLKESLSKKARVPVSCRVAAPPGQKSVQVMSGVDVEKRKE